MMVVLSTAKDKNEAKKIAKILVEEKLAACVNIIDNVTSIYYWNEVCEDNETLLIIKTTKEKINLLENKIKSIHSYEVPEIVYFEADAENNYLDWLKSYLKDKK